MSASDLEFTLLSFADWMKRHGIHQLRAVLDAATAVCAQAPDSEIAAQELQSLAAHVKSNGALPQLGPEIPDREARDIQESEGQPAPSTKEAKKSP